MTYQNLGYWVGQANDLSTGAHPTGWTNGQRWSETAGEWNAMYNTEYSSARDTSTGQHPTGWVSGQLWSTTAGQWIPMYVAEYNAARDTSGGQTNSGLGASHPAGWGYGQFWQTTAEQWNAMWGTEWRNSHDPQGYSYSYPNAGANAVYWSQTAQYWRGQTDYYYGPSRVWGSGATWEQNYNAYVGYYNDMVSQRDTWTSRANQAWGRSRIWPNGESWEAEALRVRPPDAALFYSGPATPPSLGGGGGTDWCTFPGVYSNSLGAGNGGNYIQVPKTGDYAIAASFKGWNNTGNQEALGIVLVTNVHGNVAGTNGDLRVESYWGAWVHWVVTLSANELIRVQFHTSFDQISGSGQILIAFMPNTTYAH